MTYPPDLSTLNDRLNEYEDLRTAHRARWNPVLGHDPGAPDPLTTYALWTASPSSEEVRRWSEYMTNHQNKARIRSLEHGAKIHDMIERLCKTWPPMPCPPNPYRAALDRFSLRRAVNHVATLAARMRPKKYSTDRARQRAQEAEPLPVAFAGDWMHTS